MDQSGERPIKRTRLSCRSCLRTLETPEPIKDWSLTTLKEKLIKIGGKVVGHGHYVAFQMTEVAISGILLAGMLQMILEPRPPAVVSTA
jgi:hypothetical protein